MHNKRGQITLFIVVGVILVILFSFVIYFIRLQIRTETEVEKVTERPLDVSPIRNYVEACIEYVGKEALLWIGEHGGYFELPEKSVLGSTGLVPYYFYIDRDINPKLEEIERQLSLYMDKELFFCLKNFYDFSAIGLDVEQGSAATKAIIQQNKVIFQVNLPLKIERDKSITKLLSFSKEVDNIRLYTIYGYVQAIIDKQMEDYDKICLSCITNLAIENDLYTDIQRRDDDTIIIRITDFNTKINDRPYRFIFANKYEQYSCINPPYDWDTDELEEFMEECIDQQLDAADYNLNIEKIPDSEIIVNEELSYKVLASGVGLVFSDFTDLFDINKSTGEIIFIPREADIGEHIIWIYVKDSLGNEDYEVFRLNIKENEAE